MGADNDRKLPKSLIRTIDILMRLIQGEKINSKDAARSYDVTKRTIYRDLQIIRENPIFNDNYHMEFDESHENRFVVKDEGININEILTIIQILIGVRALAKPELKEIIYHLRDLVSVKDQAKIDRLLKTEYLPVKSNGNLLSRIGEFTDFIRLQTEIEFTYQGSLRTSDNKRSRQGIPVSLYFSNFYFYVVIFSEAKGSRTYRLDRLISYKKITKSTNILRSKLEDGTTIRNYTYLLNGGRKSYFKIQCWTYPQTALDRLISYKKITKSTNILRSKLEDGTTIRNYTYLLNGGRKSYFKIQCWTYPQTALDRLPNSRIIKHEPDGSVIIEGYLYLQGLKLWIMSEGTLVKVLEPTSLVNDIKKELRAALKQYDNGDSHGE